MRKILIGFVVVLTISTVAYLRFHHPKPPLEEAYAGNRQVILWSTTAQVREPVATVTFGDRLDVLKRFDDQVQVRTTAGITGWASQQDLLSAEFWQEAKDLNVEIAGLPIEARGHTRVLSNLHLEPSREAQRIRQLAKNVPVDLFERRVAEVAPVKPKGGDVEAADPTSSAKKEDWWLIRAHISDQTTVGGWILGRFVDLDVPTPLPDYASSAGMRIVAWFELNSVSDASGKPKPQYLVVGTRGGEGQTCDFTLLRVFTWGTQRERYETAYVESDLCGQIPVKLTTPAVPSSDVTFTFADLGNGTPEERSYRMHQTIVRRVGEKGRATGQKRAH